MSDTRRLDQFYTNPNYAKHFFEVIGQTVDIASYEWIVEPSAGTGSFFELLDPQRRIGLDLEPKYDGLLSQDFLTWNAPTGRILTIGNPPFGKNAALAVRFFNHASHFSDTIAFILPKTFRKLSIINRLNVYFRCVYDETVPPNSFIYNNSTYNVWCCAQIWQRQETPRKIVVPLSLKSVSKWFTKTTPENASFAFQRVGVKAGTVKTSNLMNLSRESHHFFKTTDDRIVPLFQQLSFDDVKRNTAGNPSISIDELVRAWIKKCHEVGLF